MATPHRVESLRAALHASDGERRLCADRVSDADRLGRQERDSDR